ncbi:hypothetical protein NW762_011060 [Fusarium torreyae]|uniref:LysM domain-containing protein n=1 Tax=Fusarium torreyae TaxID=1237075 RepID=A0A9W8VA93_9HYPO|nr:hypothetical protein NW762_011060 [Fusarium torreyae]
MHFSSVINQGLLVIGAAASRSHKFRRQVNPAGPTDHDIPSDCSFYDTWADDTYPYDCGMWAKDWGLDLKQLAEYNPSVKDDCSGIQNGHAYCVEVNFGLPRDEDKPKVTSTEDAEPEPTSESKPSPTEEGLIDTCTSSHSDKTELKCTALWAKYYICVGV